MSHSNLFPIAFFPLLFIGFYLVLTAETAAAQNIETDKSEIIIGVSAQRILAARGASRISVSNGRVLKVEDLGATLRLTGRKPGIAAVSVNGKTWLVHVLTAASHHLYDRVSTAIAHMQGLEARVEDGQIVIAGRLLRVSDWLRLAELASPTTRFIFKAEPDDSLRSELLARFSDLLRSSSLPQPDLQLAPAVVRLSSERADLAARFERVLGPFGFVLEKNAGVLTLEPSVRVHILVTELRKKFMRRLGIQWPASYQAQLLPTWSAPGQSTDPLTVQLQALEETGAGRILASPNLLCRSGKEAQFLAGGEFPLKVTVRKQHDVIWKRYGVLLKIKPQADFSGRMSISLETEVSSIDTSHTIDGLPGLLTNRIESHFDLKGSRTIALSGLIRQDSGEAASGLPGLTSIPILGALFASREFREEKSELVVFVTPEVLNEGDAK